MMEGGKQRRNNVICGEALRESVKFTFFILKVCQHLKTPSPALWTPVIFCVA